MTPDHIFAVCGLLLVILGAIGAFLLKAGGIMADNRNILKYIDEERKKYSDVSSVIANQERIETKVDDLANGLTSYERRNAEDHGRIETLAAEANRKISHNMPRVIVAPPSAPSAPTHPSQGYSQIHPHTQPRALLSPAIRPRIGSKPDKKEK